MRTQPNDNAGTFRISVDADELEEIQLSLDGLTSVLVCLTSDPGTVPSDKTLKRAFYFLSMCAERDSKRLSALRAGAE